MTGKLNASAIESGTISASKLDASLNTSFNDYSPPVGINITDIQYTNGNTQFILTGSNFDANCIIYLIGDYSIQLTSFTRTNANSIIGDIPNANLASYFSNNIAPADDYLKIQVKNPDSSVAVSTLRMYYDFPGRVTGYTSGGSIPPIGAAVNTIDRFPFSALANATDVGDLTSGRYNSAGQSSSVSGYTSGGGAPPFPSPSNIIDKFPFASNANATDVGDLTQARYGTAGQSSTVNGYSSGGNIIDKFPFATDANATDVGDLSQARSYAAGQSSPANGYTSGGSGPLDTIDKFPFATDANATDVGDLSLNRFSIAGQSSVSHGYNSGGGTPWPIPPHTITNQTRIDKFPFATDTNAAFVGSLSTASYGGAGISSTTDGYQSGGFSAPTPTNTSVYRTDIQRFPFSSDTNVTGVATLSQARRSAAGQQD